MSSATDYQPPHEDAEALYGAAWSRLTVFGGIALNVVFWVIFLNAAVNGKGFFYDLAGDFGYFWGAAQAFVTEGPTAYLNVDVLRAHAQSLQHYYGQPGDYLKVGTVVYPPLFVVLLLPFTIPWSPILGFFLWTAFNLALTTFVSLRLAERVGVNRVVMTVGVLTFFPVAWSLFVGQPGGIILLALWKGIESIERERHVAAGVWFGVLLIKPHYAALLMLWLLLTRRRNVIGGVMVSGSVLLITTMALLGIGGTVQFIQAGLSYGAHIDQELPPATFDMTPTWGGFLENIPWEVHEPWNAISTVVFVSASLFALFMSHRYMPDNSTRSLAELLLVMMAVTVLINPHGQIQAVALLMIPGVIVASNRDSVARQVRQAYLITLCVLPVIGMVSIVFTGWLTWLATALFGILLITLVRLFYFRWSHRLRQSSDEPITQNATPQRASS